MERFSNALRSSTQCDGCSTRLNVFRRKRPCFSCKNYFCQVCIMQRPDKKMCCKKCQVLTATPLDRNALLNLRSRDLVNYLTSKHISTNGCVEKEDLVNVLMRAMNNSSSTSAHCFSDSVNNSFCDCPRSNSVSSGQPDSKRKPPSQQPNENLFSEDGIRIRGTDLTDNEGSCSLSSLRFNSGLVNDSDWVVVNENNEESNHELEEPNRIVDEGASGQNLNCGDLKGGDSLESAEANMKKEKSRFVQLSDISSSADLDNLSVKELKVLLMTNRTDFKGCIERGELIERASRLWSDYTLSRKDLEKLSLEELCKICMDAPIECVLLECGHMATCMNCGKQLSECPVCRRLVVRCVRTFKV